MKKCTKCAKTATLHITEIRKGAVQEVHLCESCAQEYLSLAESAEDDVEAAEEADVDAELEGIDELVCPSCGISFREFRSQGRLGCPHDYIAFEKELIPLLENIHSASQHTGKFPKRAPDASQRQYQLIKLRSELKQAVEAEDYEQAARVRDEIHRLERSTGEKPAGGRA